VIITLLIVCGAGAGVWWYRKKQSEKTDPAKAAEAAKDAATNAAAGVAGTASSAASRVKDEGFGGAHIFFCFVSLMRHFFV
jgi:3-oxoacyl-ACP reductase-like protein